MDRFVLLAIVAALSAACTHQIAFTDLHYRIQETRRHESAVAVISPTTLAMVVPVNSFMAGSAHTWNAEAGEMLRQIAAIELPQQFARCTLANSPPSPQPDTFVIALFIRHYLFAGFHADVEISANVSRAGVPLFERVYRGVGPTLAGKVVWGGAFAMKSAMRQSSLGAFQEVFRQLREDLRRPAVPAPAPIAPVSAPTAPPASTSGGEAPTAEPTPTPAEPVYPEPAPGAP